MNEIANQLVQSLFKKNSLQECSRWELEILAEHYPYFGIAQLLISGKLKEENGEAYEKQLQKTSLYFTNPLWLDYILNKKTFPPEEIITEEKKDENIVSETITDDIKEADKEPIHTEYHIELPEITEPVVEHPDFNVKETTEEVVNTSPETIFEDRRDADKEPIHSEYHTEQPEIIKPIDEHPDINVKQTTEEVANTSSESTIPEEEKVEEFKIAPLKTEPMPDENAPLVFEAFHTVDYFASQGIKLSLEEKPQDRFGQQLKSFTQWLKTIKKAPAGEIKSEPGTEQKVITLAEHSIEDRDVVTEAMAEVWLKQGNKPKAIEVYHKLSLQNPAKSSYFAGLIEQLKQH